jgi:hypothetical protein
MSWEGGGEIFLARIFLSLEICQSLIHGHGVETVQEFIFIHTFKNFSLK